MKKIILILLVLIAASTCNFAAEISDDIYDDTLIDNVTEESLKDDNESKPEIKKDTLVDKVSEINAMNNDEDKVKAWAKFNAEKNYVIINKKNCSATVYDAEGNEIKNFEIGIGVEKGDDYNDTKGVLGKAKNTTPAGEFTLIPNIYNKAAYGDITLSLGDKANKAQNTKKMVALHKVPKFRQEARLKKFYDGNLANNRMSHGCINFMEDDFKELTKYIKGGFKTYILPEEDGNELMLTKNDKGKYELAQTKY